MGDTKHARRTYRIPQPLVTPVDGEHVLQTVALPSSAEEEDHVPQHKGASRKQRKSVRFVRASTLIASGRRSRVGKDLNTLRHRADDLGMVNALAFIRNMSSCELTDREAESIAYPYHAHPYGWDDVCLALQTCLTEKADAIEWNTPRARRGWDTDMRFLGDWWLTLRDPESLISQKTRLGMRVMDTSGPASLMRPKRGEVNRPLLLAEERAVWSENQLVADLVLRMHGQLYRMETLHLDELAMTPDRLQVLMIPGLLFVQRREAERIAAESSAADDAKSDNGDGEADGRQAPTSASRSSRSALEVSIQRSVLPPVGAVDPEKAHAFHVFDSSLDDRPYSASCLIKSGRASKLASALPRGVMEVRPYSAAEWEERHQRVETQFLLKTLSLSICSIGSASVLVLLASLAAIDAEHRAHEEAETMKRLARKGRGKRRSYVRYNTSTMRSIENLDLSYNALTSSSLYCLTMLLPRTAVKRLSLRGNNLCGDDSAATRDFFFEGCQQLEELDISYTGLSMQQVCIFIEALPYLSQLRVLNLDNLNIPPERATTLSRAICHSKLLSISLNCCAACTGQAFLGFINAACERNKARARGKGEGTGRSASSFFESFFERSLSQGWVPPELCALPSGYRPFTNNDPSLHTRVAPP